MSRIGAKEWDLQPEVEDGGRYGYWVAVKPASEASVLTVLAADPGAADGHARSEWLWVRLPNGDLILGVYPQDETYFATERDHS